ncbi:hypothetical protein T440DRAFT_479017 [Plenodomus tracheiphilus IPT5]|uniref:Uncharacterized protein n=1 Tax=Plenodomus tracheiphilus IPT5 TaxID=1408161 RepID=A0A6A7B5W4_9PLEO|nr:hypothetical protein T440DRAFT_479017 [Plenodomus tracheiphilus IPT5]
MATPQQPPQQPSMRLAEILSDLVSLRVCDPAAALALVSTRAVSTHNKQITTNKSTSTNADADAAANTDTNKDEEEQDVDLKRAKELLSLHYQVKQAHKQGELRRGLEEARGSVERALG